MKVKVRRVGNSMTVTIPKEIVSDLGISPDTEMDISVRDKAVVMEPVGSRWERLVEEIRKEAAEQGLTERDIFVGIARARRDTQSAGDSHQDALSQVTSSVN